MGNSAIVLLATGWDSSQGGVNVFNRDLAVALAQVSASKVVCVVPAATKGDVRAAHKQGVLLLSLDALEPDRLPPQAVGRLPTLLQRRGIRSVTCWVGHDVHTGPAAVEARRQARSGGLAIIQHAAYERYYSLTSNDGQRAKEKSILQRRLLMQADYPCAVGPKLGRSARDALRGASKPGVLELIPGLPEIDGVEPPNTFSAVTAGRLDLRNDVLKQGRLAAAAFGRAVRSLGQLGQDATLTVIGLSKRPSETRQLQSLVRKHAGRVVPVNGLPFASDSSVVRAEIRSHSVALMLSVHEGFGLAAWEAIAAEVPLVISENSGVFELVRRTLLGPGVGCLHRVAVRGSLRPGRPDQSDVEMVARKVSYVASNVSEAKSNARSLKALLSREYDWRRTARSFAAFCEVPLVVPSFSLGLAGGFPDPEVFGYLDERKGRPTSRQRRAQEIWDRVAQGIGSLLARRPHMRLLYTGTDCGNLSSAIVRRYCAHADVPKITTYFYGDYEDEASARAARYAEDPTFFERYNMSPSAPYLNLTGDVIRTVDVNRRRTELANAADILLCASGESSVEHLLNRAMARRIPVIAIAAFGGVSYRDRNTIAFHNHNLNLSAQAEMALAACLAAPLDVTEIIGRVEQALDSCATEPPPA